MFSARRRGKQQRPAVGVAVDALFGGDVHRARDQVVVPVSSIARRGLLEKNRESAQQERLSLVDDDRGGGMEVWILTKPTSTPESATSADACRQSMNSVGLLVVRPILACEQVEVGASVSIDVLQ
jgi:hypothetical protein